jgi:outer membrane receptor protein involved in Fe transport
LSVGARDATLSFNQLNFAAGWINGGTTLAATSHAEHPVTPRYTAKFTINGDAMVYASAAKGYRIGGQNGPLPFFCAGEAISGGGYNSDSLWSYEVGSKNALFNGRMNTRAAAYRIDWNSIQQTVLLPCGYTQVQNAGAATSTGGEFEADIAPMHGLKLSMGVGFDNAKITSAPPGGSFFVGQRLSNVPKWTASLLGDYTIPKPYGAMFFREQYTFAGSSISYNNAANPTPGRERASYSLVDLIAGESRGPWDTSLVIKNLFDVRANLGDEQPLSGELLDRPRWLIAQPRTIGFQIIRRFKGQ